MSDFVKVPCISIKPNYLTFFYQVENSSKKEYESTIKRKLPRSTNNGRNLSPKAAKRLRDSIGWLVALSKTKLVRNNKTGKDFKFRINFITLTLPTIQRHFDTTIKSKCFNQFLTEIRTFHGVNNYVWRCEAQSNGSIHFHIACDTFVNYYYLRQIWNRCIRKLGYIDLYHEKFKNMSERDYIKFRYKDSNPDLSVVLKAYEYGCKSNWKDPNTTDVHSVHNIDNLAGYMAKYMSKEVEKDEEDEFFPLKGRKIKGRNWGLSQSLSKCKGVVDVVDLNVEKIWDYCVDTLKLEVFKQDYFSVLFASFRDWAGNFRKFFKALISKLKFEIDYSPGGLSPKCSSIF